MQKGPQTNPQPDYPKPPAPPAPPPVHQEKPLCLAQDVNAEPDGSGSGSALPLSDPPTCSPRGLLVLQVPQLTDGEVVDQLSEKLEEIAKSLNLVGVLVHEGVTLTPHWDQSRLLTLLERQCVAIEGLVQAMAAAEPQRAPDDGDALEVTGTDLAGRPLPRG